MTNPNWNEPIDKLKIRIKNLQGKTDEIDNIIPEINKDLDVIENGLKASKEMIEKEAEHHPKIEKSIESLDTEIATLESKITTLETNQKALKNKTAGIATISVSIGAIGGIAVWASLGKFKTWLDGRPATGRTTPI